MVFTALVLECARTVTTRLPRRHSARQPHGAGSHVDAAAAVTFGTGPGTGPGCYSARDSGLAMTIGVAVSAHLAAWRDIVDSADPKASLARHLAFLTASDDCRKLLERLLARLRRVQTAGDRLHLVFEYVEYPDKECVVVCLAPYDGPAGDVPPSMLVVARVHNGIWWEYGGGGGIGFNGLSPDGVPGGGWEYEALTDAAQENAEFLARLDAAGLGPEDVESPGDYGQNWLIWDPVQLNALGEPVLYFVSHGDCVAVPVDEARDLPYGPQLLRLMVQDILGEQMYSAVYS
jgi:hypothetical protein